MAKNAAGKKIIRQLTDPGTAGASSPIPTTSGMAPTPAPTPGQMASGHGPPMAVDRTPPCDPAQETSERGDTK
jgi:hypothetical protein